jgi:hypothetical protein
MAWTLVIWRVDKDDKAVAAFLDSWLGLLSLRSCQTCRDSAEVVDEVRFEGALNLCLVSEVALLTKLLLC